MPNSSIRITLGQYCICSQFKIEGNEQIKFNESYEKSIKKNLQPSLQKWAKTLDKKDRNEVTKLNITASVGTERKNKLKPSVKFSISSSEPVDYAIAVKVLPFIQESIDSLKQYHLSDIRFTSCTQFGFNLNQFKPLSQFPLPAELPLNVELAKKFGKARLTTFGMVFDESPIGLTKAEIEYDEEAQEINVTLSVSLKPTSLDNIVSFSYENMIQIAKLFVVERK